jgi:hypothetical protein
LPLLFLIVFSSSYKAFSQWAIDYNKAPFMGWLYHNKGVTLGDSIYPNYNLLLTRSLSTKPIVFLQIAHKIFTGVLHNDGLLIGIDKDTAIFNQQENADILFKTNATTRAVIKNNGYVGIGIISPAHILHVHGNGSTGGNSNNNGTSTSEISTSRSPNTNNKTFSIGNIGHITPASYAAIQLTNNTTGSTATDGLLLEMINNNATINLQEQGSINFRNSGKTCMQISKENNLKIGKITNITEEAKVGIFCSEQNGLLVTSVNNPDGYILKARNSGSSNALVVKGNGRVGIGTDNPHEALQIGDRFVIHNGGTKVIGYNWHYENGTSKYITDGYSSQIRFGSNGTLSFVVSPSDSAGHNITEEKYAIHITNDGKVGIGTTNPHGYELAVKGFVIAEDFTVEKYNHWPDFVFNENYKILSLTELEKFIKQNKHLPGIPSKKEVKEKGIKLGEMNAKLLQKIEELTIYIIQQQKEIEALKKEVEIIKNNKL